MRKLTLEDTEMCHCTMDILMICIMWIKEMSEKMSWGILVR